GDAHLDLFAYQRLRAVGDDGVDFDAAVHRSRMHHQRAWLCVSELLLVKSVVVEILRHRRHVGAIHAITLKAKHHYDVTVGEAFADGGGDVDSEALDAGRQERGGRDDAHTRAHRIEEDDVRARHARVKDIATDRNQQPFNLALVTADGERVEQSLGRMLVRAIAGIYHRTVNLARQQFDCAG